MKIYKRNIFQEIINDLETRKVQILLGTRQVGKTTILDLIEKHLKEKKAQVMKANLEKPEYLNTFNSYMDIIDFLEISGFSIEKRVYLLIDEFQSLPGIDKVLKVLYDEHSNIKVVATGSSSLLINRNIKEGLTGRNIIYYIYHFDFLEFVNTKDDRKVYNMIKLNKFLDIPVVQFYIEEYLLFGGYPEIILHSSVKMKQKLFSSIYTSYIQKDINFFIKQNKIPKFSELVELLADQIGNLVNINSLSQTLGINHKDIENFVFVLEQTFSVKLISPFCRNKEKEIRKMKKIYFYDLGLRNYVLKLQNLPKNQGNLAENFVFLEIVRNHDCNIKYWRTKHGTEIDFILEKNNEIIPVEVKYRNSINVKIVPANIKSFIEQYNIKKAFVITKNQQGILKYKGKKIIFLPIILTRNIDL